MAASVYSSQDPLLPAILEPTNYGSMDCGPGRGRDFTCICHEEIRLDDESIETLEKGDHISMPLKCCGGYTHCCFHHAILEAKISKDNRYKNGDVVLDVIGYSESNEGKAKIDSVQEILNYKEMDIYKIVYNYPKYEREKVTENVSKLKERGIPYHVFLNNCEHICRGCATGDEKSIQVDTLDKCCAQSVFGCLPRLLRFVLAILSTVLDEFYDNNNEWIVGTQSFALAVYFYLLVRQLVSSQFQYELKQMCKKCRQSSSRNFLMGLLFIIISVTEIIVDELLRNECIALALTIVALLFWLLTELCNVCSERCLRTTTRCDRICSIFACRRCNKCCNICDKVSSKCGQCKMDCFDSRCHCILNWCWSHLKCCSQRLKGCSSCFYTCFCFFWILCVNPNSR